MNFIKLTKPNNEPLYLLASKIYKIELSDKLTCVYYQKFGENGSYDYVKESPEEVMLLIEATAKPDSII